MSIKSNFSRMPDVYLPGFQKAGTTFLREIFEQHPDIVQTRMGARFVGSQLTLKEPEVSQDRCWIDIFEPAASGIYRVDNDKWVNYRFDPQATLDSCGILLDQELIARKMQSENPCARVILVVRNQYEWLVSHYKYFFSSLPDRQSDFEDFLQTPEGMTAIRAGHFDIAISIYDRLFGENNVHVVVFEDMVKNPVTTTCSIFRFMDINPEQVIDYEACRTNKSPDSGTIYLAKTWRRKRSYRFASKVARIFQVNKLLRRYFFLTDSRSTVMRNESRILLRSFFAASNFRLQQRVNSNLKELGYPW